MDREEFLSRVAPCGLVCYTCTMAENGAIHRHSRELLGLLTGFDSFAIKFQEYEPRLRKYASFKEILTLFSESDCKGCRGGSCTYPGCVVQPCTEEKGLDFCFECDEFPCQKVNFDPGLKRKWRTANRRMQKIGVEAYYLESKNKSHYT